MKKFIVRNTVLAIAFFISTHLCYGQNNSIPEVIHAIGELQESYTNDSLVSFNVLYTYTNETKPEEILDSTHVKIEISKKNYRCIIDSSTEMFSNDSLTIVLFKTDQIMYLTKPASAGFIQNPFIILDSILSSIGGLICRINNNEIEKQISIVFPDGMKYREINYFINNISHQLDKAVYVVKTQELMDQHNSETFNRSEYDEYAIVTAIFYDYKKDFRNAFLNNNVFFERNGNNLQTTQKYKNYKIFIGSPGLFKN